MSLRRRVARLDKNTGPLMEGMHKKIIVMNLFDRLSDDNEDPAEVLLELINIQKNM